MPDASDSPGRSVCSLSVIPVDGIWPGGVGWSVEFQPAQRDSLAVMPTRTCAICREPLTAAIDFHCGRPAHRSCVDGQRVAARQQRRDAATSAALHHPVSAVDLRRAEDQMRRSRERVNRGDSYRIGGRADAPADWQQNTEQHQNREYVQRGNAKRRRRSNGDADNV